MPDRPRSRSTFAQITAYSDGFSGKEREPTGRLMPLRQPSRRKESCQNFTIRYGQLALVSERPSEEALEEPRRQKKSKKPKEGDDDFAAKIAALTVEGEEEGEAPAAAAEKKVVDDGDMEKGTGIWQHDSEVKIPYEQLLSRFFTLLAQKNPDHASSGSRSYKIPPPQCLREGNKKTIFANIAEICKRMKRTDEHVTSYLFAELGTSGSVDGSRRLVIKGRFQQKQIENVLRRYISE